MSKLLLSVLLIFSFTTFSIATIKRNYWKEAPTTLELVHVVFRHGDRTPDNYCINEFNITKNYWPDGFGQLTDEGKNREFNIGVALREKYGPWLEDIYYPGIVGAQSTDYDRTKVSLQLVLAGLFPPSPSQLWHQDLQWQPVPTNYTEGLDELLGYPTKCNNYRRQYQKILDSPRVQRIYESKERLIEYVDENVNSNEIKDIAIGPIEGLWLVYFCLRSMEETGVPLPEWTRPIYPEILSQMAVLEYHLKALEDNLIQFTGGYLLRKMLNDTEAMIEGKTPGKKMYLYSGHEYNVALTLLAMDAFPPEVPNYGSYVVLEVHRTYDVYGFMLFYQNYAEADPVPLTIPGCSRFCPINDFKRILKARLAPSNLHC